MKIDRAQEPAEERHRSYEDHLGSSPFSERTELLRALDACCSPTRDELIRWGDEGGQLHVSTSAQPDPIEQSARSPAHGAEAR